MWLRRVRAALVVAAVWAIIWGVEGFILGVGRVTRRSHYPGFAEPVLWWATWGELVTSSAVHWMTLGAVGGLVFAVLLATRERGRTVDGLSTRRLALWGACTGSLLVLFTLARFPSHTARIVDVPIARVVMEIAFVLILGGVSAWATLQLTRSRRTSASGRAMRPPATSLAPGDEPLDGLPAKNPRNVSYAPLAHDEP